MPLQPKLEILISTMNRTNLDFVKAMFPYHKLDELNLLIVNQTNQANKLTSNLNNLRVINSTEFGLSKSRNLALKNTTAEVALLADDDVCYVKNFENKIFTAYQKHANATLICFQFLNHKNQLAKKYPSQEKQITHKSKFSVSSVEMCFNIALFRKHKLQFDENFGLGAEFPAHEEQVLKHQILQKKLQIVFIPHTILQHFTETTGANATSINYVYALTAQKYLMYGDFTYLWVFKYLYFLYRKHALNLASLVKNYKLALQAINKIKTIKSEV